MRWEWEFGFVLTIFNLLCYDIMFKISFTFLFILLFTSALSQLSQQGGDDDYLFSGEVISPRDIGMIHNEFIMMFHEKMKAMGGPRTKAEYLEMVLNETIRGFCDEEDDVS